jgi:hypothetical protein
MDDRNRRTWRVASDNLGPNTGIRPRLSRRGIGGFLFVGGNPVSFTVDPIIGCVPFLSLKGGRDAQSEATRSALDQQGDSGSFFIPGLPGAGGLPGATPSSDTPDTNGNTGTTQGKPSTVNPGPSGGPFAYIGASKTGGY